MNGRGIYRQRLSCRGQVEHQAAVSNCWLAKGMSPLAVGQWRAVSGGRSEAGGRDGEKPINLGRLAGSVNANDPADGCLHCQSARVAPFTLPELYRWVSPFA